MGGSVSEIDWRLDESQSHLPVHFLLGNTVAVPVNEEEDGRSPRYLQPKFIHWPSSSLSRYTSKVIPRRAGIRSQPNGNCSRTCR